MMAEMISKSSLLFVTNELLNPNQQRDMRLPFKYIVFGITEGRMFKHFRSNSTFITPNNVKKAWGNSVVYGSIFLIDNFDYYAPILDAYHLCSMSTLQGNQRWDIHHRIKVNVNPIHFNTLDELASLKYKEGEPIEVETYIGNVDHPKINQRINNSHSLRVIDGVNPHFKSLFMEVNNN